MDFLKKFIEEEEKKKQQQNADSAKDIDFLETKLKLAYNVYAKFEENSKLILQNVKVESAVEFSKDILLLLYEFFEPENDGLKVKDFLINWPPESHEELIRSIELLVNANILLKADETIKSSSNEISIPPTVEKNVHINLINHHYMLKDYVRLAAYRRAIENKVQSGSVAMDLGTGTGILAFFAAKKGASKVYAIERRQDIVELSKELATENGIIDKIEYITGNSTSIPETKIEHKVDVFISEILGSGIFEENILEFTMDARDRFCKPNASLIPCKLDVFVFGYDADKQQNLDLETEEIEKLYDIKLTKYKKALKNFISATYERYNPLIYKTMSHPVLAKSIDFKTLNSPVFEDKIELEITEDGNLNAFCAYFLAHLDETTTLTNSPWAPNTHWIQKVFLMPQSLKVTRGQKIPLKSIYDGDYRVELTLE